MKNPNKELYMAEPFIAPDNIQLYANTNEAHLQVPARGVILEFPGLGGGSCLGGSMDRRDYGSEFALRCAEKGILLAYLFPGPWSWGNRAAIRMADAVVSAIAKKHDLKEHFPLVVCGGSMGGLGSLMFACDTAHDLTACMAACPCVDVPSAVYAHPDFPRTFISAVAGYDMPLTDALEAISPAHRLQDLPHIPYFICSDGEDEVFPESRCDQFIDDMRQRGHEVTYFRQPGMPHGGFLPEVYAQLCDFRIQYATGKTEKV